MAASLGPKIITNGLLLALDAADRNSYPGSGTLWTDLSGQGNNGALTNGPTYSSANGGGIVFDAIDDNVDLGTGASITSLTDNITVDVWIKTSSPNSRLTIYGNGYAGTGMMFGTSANTPGGLEVYYPGVYVAYSAAGVLQADIWQHVVYARNGSGAGNHSFYINGASQSLTESAVASWATSGTNRYLGLRGGVMFSGSMASVKVYNRALSGTEILQNFNAEMKRFGL